MPDQLQLRGGTTTEHNSFTGAAREVTVDTTKKTLVVHDGSQAGGTPLMKESGATAASSVQIGTGGVERFKITSSEVVFNETSTDTDFRIEGNGEANLFKVDAGTDLIGIGTSSPSTRLHVEGSQDSLLFLKSTDAGSGLAAADNSGSSIIQNIGGSFRVLTGGDPNVVGTASTEKFRITGSGNVGIGTNNPQEELHISADTPVLRLTDSSTDRHAQFVCIDGSLRVDADNNNAQANTNIAFRTDGTERMRIDSSGNVGIGTTNPSSKLHVSSSESVALFDGNPSTSNVYVDINAAANRRGVIRFQSAGTNKWSIGRGDSDEFSENNFHISTGSSGGNAAKLVVTSAGNVGIGTTSPNRHLHLHESDSTGAVVRFTNTTTGSGENDGLTVGINGSEQAEFWQRENTAMVFGTNNTERMRIDTSGRLLVGQTSGSSPFCVSGTDPVIAELHHSDGGQNDQARISLGALANNPPSNRGVNLIAENNGAGHDFVVACSASHSAGPSEKMRIDSSGRLLIGRTSPQTSETDFLDIAAPHTAGHQSVQLSGHTTSSFSGSSVLKCNLHGFYRQSYGQNGFLFKNGDDTTHNRGVRVHQYQNNDSTVVGSIFFNTNSTDFNTSSDYRLKENEVLISDGISRIKRLKPYRFNFKNFASEIVDGFFAHEVAEVVPHAVGGEKDEMKPNAWYQEGDTIPSGKSVGDVKGYSSTEMEIQQLDYSKLVTVTIAALQEAITKIETLETKVAALEAA